MKLKKLFNISLALASVALFHSCDGGGGGSTDDDIAENQQDRAKVLDTLLMGDKVDFDVISKLDQHVPVNFFSDAQGVVVVDNTRHIGVVGFKLTYHVTNVRGYEFDYSGDYNEALGDFHTAINALLGAPSDIDSPFRDALLEPGTAKAQLSRAKLQEIADDLYDEGVLCYLHPTEDVIFVPRKMIYTFTSESTNGDLLRGLMSGTYVAEMTGDIVGFRRPTAEEVATYNTGIRAMTMSHWIPTLVRSPGTIDVEFEAGDYSVRLVNKPTDIK